MNRTWSEAAQLLGLHFELGIVLVLLALHASERFVHRRRQGRVRDDRPDMPQCRRNDDFGQ